MQDRLPFSAVQIERERALVEVEGVEIDALTGFKKMRADRPRGIAAAFSVFMRRFDLDDLCPQLRQKLRAIGPRAILFGAEDAITGEGERAGQFPSPFRGEGQLAERAGRGSDVAASTALKTVSVSPNT